MEDEADQLAAALEGGFSLQSAYVPSACLPDTSTPNPAEIRHFHDSFWNEKGKVDVESLDAVFSCVQKGLDSLEEYGAFLKIRANCELQYASALERLGAREGKKLGNLESTTSRIVMAQARLEAENSSQMRKQFAERLETEVVTRIQEFVKVRSQEIQRLRVVHEKAIADMKGRRMKVLAAKQLLEKRSREAVSADAVYDKAVKSGKVPHMALMAFKIKVKKAEMEVIKTTKDYQAIIQQMKETEDVYFPLRMDLAEKLEALEEARMENLKEIAVLYGSLEGDMVPIIEHSHNRLYQRAEEVNPTADLQELIDKKKLKGTEPKRAEYVPMEQVRSNGRVLEYDSNGDLDLRDHVNVKIEGWMTKEGAGGHRFHTKKRRYFVLSDDELLYFGKQTTAGQLENLEQTDVKGRIPLDDVTVKLSGEREYTFIAETGPRGRNKSYLISANNASQFEEWLAAMEAQNVQVERRRTSEPPRNPPVAGSVQPSQPSQEAEDDSDDEAQRMLRVLYEYEGQSAEELPLKPGDKIKLDVGGDQDPEWWYGTSESTGRHGAFPANYVEVIP